MKSASDRLFGWTPFRAACVDGRMTLDWCHLGDRRPIEPLFVETIAQAMQDPFNLAFQQHTPVEVLETLPAGLPVGGFVFHMSRCGATLVSRLLAAFDCNTVASEPAPLQAVLRAAASGRITREQAETWLAGLVNAYAQQRFCYEQRLFLRLAATDALDIALVLRAFTDVPWIFLTRDPAEILASQYAAPDPEFLPGCFALQRLGLADRTARAMEESDIRATVLAALGRAALDGRTAGRGMFVDHSELPDALWSRIFPHFGMLPDAGTVEAMRAMSLPHAKAPGTLYARERDPARAGAARFRAVADRVAGPVMEAIAKVRDAGPASPTAP